MRKIIETEIYSKRQIKKDIKRNIMRERKTNKKERKIIYK